MVCKLQEASDHSSMTTCEGSKKSKTKTSLGTSAMQAAGGKHDHSYLHWCVESATVPARSCFCCIWTAPIDEFTDGGPWSWANKGGDDLALQPPEGNLPRNSWSHGRWTTTKGRAGGRGAALSEANPGSGSKIGELYRGSVVVPFWDYLIGSYI